MDNYLRDQIKQITPDELEKYGVIQLAKSKNKINGFCTYVCPECNNGTGKGKTGAGLAVMHDEQGYKYKCFSCGKFFDNIELLAIFYGLDTRADFQEILNRAAEEFGIATDFKSFHNLQPVKIEKPVAQVTKNPAPAVDNSDKQKKIIKMVQKDIALAQENLQNLPADARRGLSFDTLKFFNCGYLENWQHPKLLLEGKKPPVSRRLIIPTKNHYNAVALPVDRKSIGKQWWKMHTTPIETFGLQTISARTDVIFVFEGEIDAMSAFQAFKVIYNDYCDNGICAFVATCSASRTGFITEIDNLCNKLDICPYIVIVFDNDDTGKAQAEKRVAELQALNLPATFQFLSDKDTKFDANDFLTKYPALLDGENCTEGELKLFDKLRHFWSLIDTDYSAKRGELQQARRVAKEKAAEEQKKQEEKAAAELKAAKQNDFLQKLFHLPFSDTDNATRIYLAFGDVIRYSRDTEFWGFFEGGVWNFPTKSISALYPFTRKLAKMIDDNRPKFHYVTNASGGISLDTSKQQPKDANAVNAGETLSRKWKERKTQSNAIELLKGVREVTIRQADLDKYPLLLNVGNGTLDLETGKFYPHDPRQLLTKQCNVIYNPAARAPLFEQFLEEILPDGITRAAVLRYLGYSLTGLTREEKALFVFGKGGNGKGTLFKTILKLLGSYGTAFNINALLKQKNPKDGEAPTTEFCKLEGARLVVADEIPLNSSLNVAKFKSTTAGDPIPIRPLFQPARVINVPTHKFVLSGNDLPKPESADDDGINRRLYIVNFPMQYIGDAADLTLKARLETEESLSGILNILLSECLVWQKEGLIESEAMKAEKRQYIADNNFIAAFIEDNCELGAEFACTRKAFLDKLKKSYPQAGKFRDKQLIEMIQKIDGISYKRSSGSSVYKRAWIFEGVRFFDDEPVDVPFD